MCLWSFALSLNENAKDLVLRLVIEFPQRYEKNMKKYEKIWKKYEILWKNMKKYEKYEKLWKNMKNMKNRKLNLFWKQKR